MRKLFLLAAFFYPIFLFSCKINEDEKTDPTTQTYKVTLNANGGTMTNGDTTVEKSYSAKYNETINLDTAILLGLSRDGYNFKGWSESENDTQYTSSSDFKDGTALNVRSNIILYAIWSQIEPVYYYVSSNGNDNSGDGTESKPYATLTKAFKNISSSDNDYVFYVSGSITDSPELKDTYVAPISANSVTISGKTDSGSDSIIGTVSILAPNKVTLKNITLKGGNGKTVASYTYGGCLYIASGYGTDGTDGKANVYLSEVVISGGKAGYGGAVCNKNGNLYIDDNCSFFENTATVSGGAICNDGGSVTINGATISENKAASSAGGIYNNGGIVNLSSGTISKNTAPFGAGIANYGTLNLTGGLISENTADSRAGGVYNEGIFAFSNGMISKNSAGAKGGGVYNSGDFTLSGGTISENSLSSDSSYGAGVYNEKTFSMTSGEISSNECTNGNGGGLSNAGENAVSTISYGYIRNNTALNGGGIYNEGGSVTMTSVKYLSDVTFSTSPQITGNSASFSGGGAYIKSGTFLIQAGAIDSYGKRTASDGQNYYQGNKADSGNSWYRENDGVIKISLYAQNSAAKDVIETKVEQTETFSDADVTVGISGWIGISE